MLLTGYLICTIICLIILMGLFFLIKKDISWLDYVNVISKSDYSLDKLVLANLIRKMLLEFSLLIILNTIIIFLLAGFTKVNDEFYFYIYFLSVIPVIIYKVRVKRVKEENYD